MTKLIRFSLLLASAFGAWGLWLAEVCWVKGWAGLAWLSGFNWSGLPICALIVVTASYIAAPTAKRSSRVMFIAVGWLATVAAFVIARWAAFELFSGSVPGGVGLGAILVLIATGLIVSVGLTVSADRWLVSLHYWTGILIAIGLLLVVPLSFATIKVFPALNGSTDQVHSIKMGYPVFWTAVVVPGALLMGRRKRPEPVNKTG